MATPREISWLFENAGLAAAYSRNDPPRWSQLGDSKPMVGPKNREAKTQNDYLEAIITSLRVDRRGMVKYVGSLGKRAPGDVDYSNARLNLALTHLAAAFDSDDHLVREVGREVVEAIGTAAEPYDRAARWENLTGDAFTAKHQAGKAAQRLLGNADWVTSVLPDGEETADHGVALVAWLREGGTAIGHVIRDWTVHEDDKKLMAELRQALETHTDLQALALESDGGKTALAALELAPAELLMGSAHLPYDMQPFA